MNPPMRRRAKIRLDEQVLLHLMDLPEGMRVLAFDVRNDPPAINVIVESPDLPDVPTNAEAPIAYARSEVTIGEDGERTVKTVYDWPTREQIWGD